MRRMNFGDTISTQGSSAASQQRNNPFCFSYAASAAEGS